MHQNLVYFGTPATSAQLLRRLIAAKFSIAAVVTQPDRPAGRKRELLPTPVKTAAEDYGIPVLQPLRISEIVPKVRALGSAAGILYAYGRMIPAEVLGVFPFGIVNLHPSLLPLYRGPSPITQAILDGAATTGISLIRLDDELDHGPLVYQQSITLEGNENALLLEDQLVSLGGTALCDKLPLYLAGKLPLSPQRHADATYTKIIRREDGRIDWDNSAQRIERQSRAYYPWPGIFTTWNGKRLKIVQVSAAAGATGGPGTVQASGGRIQVACGEGSLLIDRLHLEGRAELSAGEFLRGSPEIDRARLG